MQSFGGGVDLDRFLDELRIPHELDLALSRPDEHYQRLTHLAGDPATAPPPPKKPAMPPSRHHQELLRRLNSSRDFGSHKQDLSIVKLPKAIPGGGGGTDDGDKMLDEYMDRIQQMENKKRRAGQDGQPAVAASASGRQMSKSASTDNVLANEFMVARQKFGLSSFDEAESDRETPDGRRGTGRRGVNLAQQNGGGQSDSSFTVNKLDDAPV